MNRLSRLLTVAILPCTLVFIAACGDDDSGNIPSDPGVNGTNLPSGGSPSNPAGKYVGHFLPDGWQVDADLATYFSVCETQMVYIDGDRNLVVGDENDDLVDPVTIPLEKDGATYNGQLVLPEDEGAQLTVTVALQYNDTSKRWEIDLQQDLDTNADGTPEASGTAVMRLEPRLDWTTLRDEANGTFDGLLVESRPTDSATAAGYILVGGGSEFAVRSRFQVDAEGAFYGQGPIAWFFDGADGPTALITDEDGACNEIVVGTLAGDYSEMTVRRFTRPETLTDPDYTQWTHTETEFYSMYGGSSLLPDFQQSGVTLTAKAGSQIDQDTDGQDAASAPYFYFGDDVASSLTAQISINPIATGTATITPPPATGEDPFQVNYGYLRVDGQGYLVMIHSADYGSGEDRGVSLDTFVLAVDENGQLTGDGVLQGYDIPQRQGGDSSIDEQEWRAMDNEGLLQFGDGLDPDLFDFVVTRASGPTPL